METSEYPNNCLVRMVSTNFLCHVVACISPIEGTLTVGDSGVALIMDRATDENEGIDFVDFLTFYK